jgi:hypothetical protein
MYFYLLFLNLVDTTYTDEESKSILISLFSNLFEIIYENIINNEIIFNKTIVIDFFLINNKIIKIRIGFF